MAGFNPEPSAVRIGRMLGMHVQHQMPTFNAAVRSPAPPHMRMPRIGRAEGGIIDSPAAPFTGPIATRGAGRADDVPMHVPPGSYVIPADVVSHVGQGNSLAGLSVLSMMFKPPWGAQGAPWGAQVQPLRKGPGVGIPKPIQPKVTGFTRPVIDVRGAVPPTEGGRIGEQPVAAHGGVVPPGSQQPGTPINASGGEFVIPPEEVKRRGGGDMGKGHRVLDAFVKAMRQDHIATLRKLPGPAR